MCDSSCISLGDAAETPKDHFYCGSRKFVDNKNKWLLGNPCAKFVGFGCTHAPLGDEQLAFFQTIDHSCLTQIALRGNFTDRTVEMIAQAIECSQTIQNVLIWSNHITLKSYEMIANALKVNKSLKLLEISNNAVPLPVKTIRSFFVQALEINPIRNWDSEWVFRDTKTWLIFEFSAPIDATYKISVMSPLN